MWSPRVDGVTQDSWRLFSEFTRGFPLAPNISGLSKRCIRSGMSEAVHNCILHFTDWSHVHSCLTAQIVSVIMGSVSPLESVICPVIFLSQISTEYGGGKDISVNYQNANKWSDLFTLNLMLSDSSSFFGGDGMSSEALVALDGIKGIKIHAT